MYEVGDGDEKIQVMLSDDRKAYPKGSDKPAFVVDAKGNWFTADGKPFLGTVKHVG